MVYECMMMDAMKFYCTISKTGESCVMSILGGLHNDTSKVKATQKKKLRYYLSQTMNCIF